MKNKSFFLQNFFKGLFLSLVLMGCHQKESSPVVVVYTSHDSIYSRPIFQLFEQRTKIRVLADYDTEANKSVGMVTKLINEKEHPKCDVYWNNQVARTIQLKKRGILAKTNSSQLPFLDPHFIDPEQTWIGFAARARVLIYNTNRLKKEELPKSILELVEPKWRGKFTMAYPLFGTTASHAAALFQHLGEEKAKQFFEGLLKNEVLVLDGNAMVKDYVVDGVVPLGWTDTDDAYLAKLEGKPVDFYFPDQQDGEMGTLFIPNTVSLIQGAPHPKEAQMFIDFLLSREVEELLAHSHARQIPLRKDAISPNEGLKKESIKTIPVSFEEIASQLEVTDRYLQKKFSK